MRRPEKFYDDIYSASPAVQQLAVAILTQARVPSEMRQDAARASREAQVPLSMGEAAQGRGIAGELDTNLPTHTQFIREAQVRQRLINPADVKGFGTRGSSGDRLPSEMLETLEDRLDTAVEDADKCDMVGLLSDLASASRIGAIWTRGNVPATTRGVAFHLEEVSLIDELIDLAIAKAGDEARNHASHCKCEVVPHHSLRGSS